MWFFTPFKSTRERERRIQKERFQISSVNKEGEKKGFFALNEISFFFILVTSVKSFVEFMIADFSANHRRDTHTTFFFLFQNSRKGLRPQYRAIRIHSPEKVNWRELARSWFWESATPQSPPYNTPVFCSACIDWKKKEKESFGEALTNAAAVAGIFVLIFPFAAAKYQSWLRMMFRNLRCFSLATDRTPRALKAPFIDLRFNFLDPIWWVRFFGLRSKLTVSYTTCGSTLASFVFAELWKSSTYVFIPLVFPMIV